jgi:hypothetical protein
VRRSFARHDSDRCEVLFRPVPKQHCRRNAVLHARALCEVFLDETDEKQGGIRVWRLLADPEWRGKDSYTRLAERLEVLKDTYNGKGRFQGSPRQAFNQMVLHSTIHRNLSRDYEKPLREVEPLIRDIIVEIESLSGYHFEPLA